DTSGPSLNILIKLMSVVALVIAPTLVSFSSGDEVGITKEDGTVITISEDGIKASQSLEKQIKVELSNTADGAFKALVTTSTQVNGKLVQDSKEFIGETKEE